MHDAHNSTALEGNTLVLREVGRQRGPGASRRHDIQPFPGGMTPPSFALVDVEVCTWRARTWGMGKTGAHLVERLASLRPSSAPSSSASTLFWTASAGQDRCR